uniref:Uncharacterized protein n=1 Tax=Rhizophora mucronata TaxID=61149 RepID=A0A2P2KLC0_RHIMU
MAKSDSFTSPPLPAPAALAPVNSFLIDDRCWILF